MAKEKNVGRAPTLKKLPVEELRLRIAPKVEALKDGAAALRMDVQNRKYVELVLDMAVLEELVTRLRPYRIEIARRLGR